MSAIERLRVQLQMEATEHVSRAQIDMTQESLGRPEHQVGMLLDELQDGVEEFHPQGVYFRPPRGAEGIAFAVIGDADHRVIINPASRELRPAGTCEQGEGGLYGMKSWVLFVDAEGNLNIGGGEGRAYLAEEEGTDDAKSRPAMRLLPSGEIQVLDKEGNQRMKVMPDGTIELGQAPTDFVALASLVEGALGDLRSAFNTHIHGAAGAPTTTAVDPSTMEVFTVSDPGSLGSEKVRSE